MENSVIKIQNLSVGYGNNSIAKNINLSAEKGDLIGLVGRNGCGKSTLLHSVAGLLKIICGTIFLDNENLETLSVSEVAKRISIVLSYRINVTNLTVRDLIAIGRHPHLLWTGKLSVSDKEIIHNAAKCVGLEDFMLRKISHLSDGEHQRALIAMTVAQDTPIILLDEPTAHLDLPAKAEILLLLKKLAKERQKTIVFSTHDLSLSTQIADKFWVMHNKTVTKYDSNSPQLKSKLTEIFESDILRFNSSNNTFEIL